jgi:segregation and condensation protein B
MNTTDITNAAEAILFIAGEGVQIKKFCEVFEISQNDFERIMNDFMDKYNYESRGLKIIRYDDCYQLTTRPECAEYLKIYAGSKKPNNLSNAAMEVLSIIAYNQPVTRGTVDKIRGVDSFGPLEKLLSREIIEEKGRLEAPGRPILYGTTKEFLKIFGLKNLQDLPELESVQLSVEDMAEIEEEVQE